MSDEYQDLLDNKGFTLELIEQWDKKDISWIDEIGATKILRQIKKCNKNTKHSYYILTSILQSSNLYFDDGRTYDLSILTRVSV